MFYRTHIYISLTWLPPLEVGGQGGQRTGQWAGTVLSQCRGRLCLETGVWSTLARKHRVKPGSDCWRWCWMSRRRWPSLSAGGVLCRPHPRRNTSGRVEPGRERPPSSAEFPGFRPVAWGRSRPGYGSNSHRLKRPTSVLSLGPTDVPGIGRVFRRAARANLVATSPRCFGKEVPMPLIKPRTRGKQFVRHRTRLDRENTETLYAYARFLGESTEYVLNQVIDTVLAKDKEFAHWRTDHPESHVPRPVARRAGAKLGQRRPDAQPAASADARAVALTN